MLRLALTLTVAVSLHAQPDPTTFFETKVRPVLAERCYSCHSANAKTPFAGLLLDSREAAIKGGDRGPAIVPGKPADSLLIQAIRHRAVQMPPGQKLPEDQIAALEQWVEIGAPWPAAPREANTAKAHPTPGKDHWAWKPIQAQNKSIDAHIEAALARQNLRLSPEATRRTLIRRLSYSLTGLPPSFEEVEAFANGASPAAYENLVDRLLASPHFGERWARHWLDLARYSDAGFNNVRFPYSFTYRDWVIGAFNADMPYDSFVKRQLAADLYSERQHLPALGLLSLGHNPPRASLVPDKIDDRIDVVSRTLLGLTVSCARCHDHKYDPIPTKDYYSLYGVFLNSFEPLVPASVDSASGPLDRFYLPRLQERLQTIEDYRKRRTEEISREMGEPETAAKYLQAAWDARSLTNPQAENLAKERNINLYVFKRWRKWAESAGASRPDIAAALAGMAGQADAPYRIPLADFGHVMTEGDSNTVNNLRWHWDRLYTDFAQRGSARRAMAVADRETIEPSFVFVRGNMNDLGEQVPRRFLSILGGREFHHGSGRKELAEAITNPGNPLTARVMANRVWQHLFGEGLVRTTSDFGIRGDAPTHPELLDDLAAAFISGGWSVKKLIRRIVLSKTYRQSSADVAAARLKDPENKLLWRMNRRRLDFDAARDTILAAGGGIDRTIGGPSFSLYSQPAESRRTLYAFVERERAQMLMKSFDYADPEQHTAQRHLTTVPQQALFLLNSTFAGEQARLLAARAGRDVTRLYRLALQRDPQARELELADRFLSASKPEAEAQTPPGVWSYGWGSAAAFTPFRYFSDDAWQASSLPPDREAGAAKLTATGGIPGDDTAHAVIRRWTSPIDGAIEIKATLSQPFGPYEQRFHLSNGIRGRVVSSRRGVLGEWSIDPPKVEKFTNNETVKVETNLSLAVARGEIIDFIVDSRDDYESDSFTWAPVISGGGQTWDAKTDFAGPATRPLNSWEQLAQVLLLTNELMYVD